MGEESGDRQSASLFGGNVHEREREREREVYECGRLVGEHSKFVSLKDQVRGAGGAGGEGAREEGLC